jgi:hypothetical protein
MRSDDALSASEEPPAPRPSPASVVQEDLERVRPGQPRSHADHVHHDGQSGLPPAPHPGLPAATAYATSASNGMLPGETASVVIGPLGCCSAPSGPGYAVCPCRPLHAAYRLPVQAWSRIVVAPLACTGDVERVTADDQAVQASTCHSTPSSGTRAPACYHQLRQRLGPLPVTPAFGCTDRGARVRP